MYCNVCGHPLNEYGICPVCGNNPYNQDNPNQTYIYPSYNQESSSQNAYGQNNFNQNIYAEPMYMDIQGSSPYANSANKKKKKGALIACICCGVVIIGTAAAVLIHNNLKVKDYTTTDETEELTVTTADDTAEASTDEPLVTGEDKTIMMYVVGSNLESEYGAASDDITEILNSGLDSSVNYIIYTGGSNDWNNYDISSSSNETFLVQDGELVQINEEEQRNMGDADTLTDFLTYCYDNYPAEQYGLILWNHGGGAFSGYGYDEITEDSLTLTELSDAFSASPFNEDNKLEFIGFDACLMANIETAHILSPYANYLIASQEAEPGWGWDYSFLDDADSLDSGADIGEVIADSYIESNEENFSVNPFSYCDVTMSVLDLSKTDDVEAALDGLFSKANGSLNEQTYVKYSRIRSNTKELAPEYTDEYSYDAVDLMNLSQNMKTEFLPEATELETALSDFIVYNNTNESGANGVSIYYPYNAKQSSGYYIPMYYDFDFATDYADYISNFATLLCGESTLTAQWDANSMIPVANGDMTFTLQLTDEQAASCQKAYYVISRADTEQPGNFMFVTMSSETTLSDTNALTADFDGQIIYIQNDTTLEQYELMYIEQESTESYTRYLLSSILYNGAIEDDDAEYVYFVMETSDEHPEGQILGAYPLENYIVSNGNDIFPERYEIDVNSYQNAAFGSASHQFTSEEDLTNFNEEDWSDVEIWYSSFPIGEGFSTVTGSMMPDIPYYGMFIIEDAQGNRHCSGLVQLQ